MTTAHRLMAVIRLEEARDNVTDARDGSPDEGGVIIAGSDLYEKLSRIIRDLDSAIDGLRY